MATYLFVNSKFDPQKKYLENKQKIYQQQIINQKQNLKHCPL